MFSGFDVDDSSSELIDAGVCGINARLSEAAGVDGYIEDMIEPGSVVPSD